jgi:Ca2+/Na+ antiporter
LQVCVSLLCLVFLIFHRRWTMAIICTLAPPIGMLLFWFAAGQRMANLPGFLSASIQLISGYSEAMSLPGPRRQVALFLAGALAILLAIILARSLRRSLRLLLLLAYAFYLLFAFKEGFVRQDGHVNIAFIALAPASLFLMLLQTPQRKRFSLVLCSIALLATTTGIGYAWREYFVDGALDEGVPPATIHGLTGWALLTRLHTELGSGKLLELAILSEPQVAPHAPWLYSLRSWHDRFDDARREINASSQLDFDLKGTVDVYSFEQSALLSRGYDWDPRPVFQSYSAYTPELIQINEQHLRGTGAPDDIVFQLDTIDDRLPALDDGLSWPAMLDNYRVAEVSGDWVHLTRNPTPIRTKSRFTLLRTTSARLGQEVVVPSGIGPVFVQIELAPSFYGRLVDMAYKLPILELTLTCSDNHRAVYRVVAGMMKTGFFVSPLITDNAGIERLFDSSQPSKEGIKVLSMRLDSNGRGWSSTYRITFRQYEYGSS